MMVKISDKTLGYILLRELIHKDAGEIINKPTRLKSIVNSIDYAEKNSLGIAPAINLIISNLRKLKPPVKTKHIKVIEGLLKNYVKGSTALTTLSVVCKIAAPLCNDAVNECPKDKFLIQAQKIALDKLAKNGDAAIEGLINEWDHFTKFSCMNMENEISFKLMQRLHKDLNKYRGSLGTDIIDYLIIGCLQEFERRAGQKRKSRSGKDLQAAVTTIMEYLKVKVDPVPKLITGTIEADLILPYGGWKCLVSCKRTGRERVKQLSVEKAELTAQRIRNIIWFFTDFDQSENRIIDLGIRGALFYLPDSSEAYQEYSSNAKTKSYIFPLSGIRKSLPKILKGDFS